MLGPDAAPPDQSDIGGLTAGVLVAGGGGRVVDGGQGFELRVPEQPALPGELASWWDAVGGRTFVRSDTTSAVLVRPDGYCFGAADDPVVLLAELRATLTRTPG